MNLLSVEFFAEAIQKQSGMYVLLPLGKGPFSVVYLLHGLSDNHSGWERYGRIENDVEGRNIIVVMPDGGRSFYCNDPRVGGLAYEDHIVKDVVGFVDSAFHTIPSRQGRALVGLSMGGYGSVMLSLRHPDMFAAASGHSSAIDFTHSDYRRHGINLAGIFPKSRYDCFVLTRKLVKARRRPHLRLDCGVNDFLIQENRQFHAHLDKIGYKHVYEEFPGEHNWDYWSRHVSKSLDFVSKYLKGSAKCGVRSAE